MLKINYEMTAFSNEVICYIWPIDSMKAHSTAIQASMKNYGIKDFKFEVMDRGIPGPHGTKITTYRLKTITLDGLMHFYIVSIGPMGAYAMDEYGLIIQGWGWKKVRIEPQYEITYCDGGK